ncbi:MAG: Nif3-like dinuclear metal center hexameric protein [Clostridiales bacterium]|nr:Nif3-like dinuclear metal center hexameric protein [Clostridiales bacterium]
MHIDEFCALMDAIAPPALAWEGDNIGLLVGTEREEIARVLVALDCTPPVIAEAVEKGADLILTHHPSIKDPLTRLSHRDLPYLLARHGIAHFAAHTNLDAAQGGVNDCLAACMGLENLRPLPPENLGRVGTLPTPCTLSEFLELCRERLQATPLYAGDLSQRIETVALVGGGGASDLQKAAAAGADILLTGDAKHSDALFARALGIALAVCGHYETESVVLKPLIARLQAADNGVQYMLSENDRAALRVFQS